jgi:integral membrane protein (TIGR01906 family)
VRRVATVLLGLALAVLVVGLALVPLTQPLFTRTLSGRYSLAREAGLSQSRMIEVAEQVRAFVAEPQPATLPAQVDGRSGFDASAVAHLADVRRVISAALIFTWVLAMLLAAWVWVELSRQHAERVARALRAGAIWCAVLVVLAAVAGMTNFDALFTAFHGLFFAEGTWTFAADSLLIQTFPEQFWATAAAVWAGLILLGAAALALSARALARSHSASVPASEKSSSHNGA